MAEELTPHLTRLQYVRGYLNSLQAEQANIDFNYEANTTFQLTGETLGTAFQESQSIQHLAHRQMQPLTALKYKDVVQDSTTATVSLSKEELAFAYTAADLLVPVIKQTYNRDGIKMPTMLFKGFIAEQLSKARMSASIPDYVDPSSTPDIEEEEFEIKRPPAFGNMGGDYFVPETDNEFSDVEDIRKSDARRKPTKSMRPGMKKEHLYADKTPKLTGPKMKKKERSDEFTERFPESGVETPMEEEFFTPRAEKRPNPVGLRDRRNRRRIFGDLGTGVTAYPVIRGRGMYYPVGENHYIDMNKLEKGYVNVKNLNFKQVGKQEPVGGNLASAVKSVLNGKNPKVDDIEPLNDFERSYLNKLGKLTGEGNFHVPLKDKTQDEKDAHQFEVMKGEIIAGNDNKQMIKEFKLLLLKLMKSHRINKKEGSDILLELAALGF